MRLDDSQELTALVEANVDLPEPGSGDLLVQVYGAGVIPTELLWYPTTHKAVPNALAPFPVTNFPEWLPRLARVSPG